ncbi:MAG: hypothetical protein O8C61_05550 [Candidatus Methanoperedens sp.]|nr:hypothetical protein [Candidatus Methanoperedens sp.]
MTTRTVVLECGCKVVIGFNAMDFDVCRAEDVEIRGSMAVPCKIHGGHD